MDSAMYSASAELRATAGWSLLPKHIKSLFNQMSQPVRERLVSLHDAQSESTEALSVHGSAGDLPEEVYSRPKLAVCLT